MGHGHGHGHGISPAQAASASSKHLRRLWLAAGLGLVTFGAQVVVGLSTGSLALLSDSAHVFTDVSGILMAIAAILIAQRASARANRTFGLYRTEVFAALFNAVLLFAVAGWVLYEAIDRFEEPPEVPGLPVSIVAVVGLVMNVAALLLLRSGAEESINVRGAYLEVMADMLGSIGVLVSGLVTLLFGWRYADPIIGVAIGLFVLPRAFSLGKGALRILLQHAPERIDVAGMTADLSALPGVQEAHDLHVWTLTSGMEVASAHLKVDADADSSAVLVAAQRLLAEKYQLEHATLQIETAEAASRCQQLSW
ncbi:cobalt-zinc-cadmium efflux system protein [Saccharopolyspora antimicrobica]|uniref:Cobalt-zinc-cadmium efflux system protein n=1 Tax=Saccharopolyspora antimicrobica TaxID=455193 RepID=A0A1I5LW43_9PSEU|nr:cation diffusion facilitator family transporter [Saccharopolyspora antimicrobica]RKT89035.1 cobalt-zinc-cadmium efflux system protein [Saccharopolyspora antimicrobica]SFP01452.1 cobalt-zinc-cadmium efflux system protein [Saccharopolyspora antimicrobica]